MRVIGLDGRSHAWDLTGHQPLGSDERPRSSLHLRARALLALLYPTDARLEELPLPDRRLWFDFFLPLRKLAVECQGPQHTAFVAHFHRDAAGYLACLRRDVDKKRFCLLNGLRLVELPHDGTDDDWLDLLGLRLLG